MSSSLTPVKPVFVTSAIPIPKILNYGDLLKTLARGDSFSISPADKKLVQAEAKKIRCEIHIGLHEHLLRVWVLRPAPASCEPIDNLAHSVAAFAKTFGGLDGPGVWSGGAVELFLALDESVGVPSGWVSPRWLGRGLAELGRQSGSGVSIERFDPKRGNRYRLDLDALRASVSRPDPESAILAPEVADTSLAANVSTN